MTKFTNDLFKDFMRLYECFILVNYILTKMRQQNEAENGGEADMEKEFGD